MISVGTPNLWAFCALFSCVALCIDAFTMNKQGAHTLSMRHANIWSPISEAVSFVFVSVSDNPATRVTSDAKGQEFVTGYLA